MTKVLLVEDSDVNRELLVRRLSRRGYEVDEASDGLDCIDIALASKPDVILMDMGLPGLDGWQAAQRLREAKFEAPNIALTAHAMAEDRERALSAGCSDYLTKPVNFTDLVESIERFAEKTSHSIKKTHQAVEKRPPEGPCASVLSSALLRSHAHSLRNYLSTFTTAAALLEEDGNNPQTQKSVTELIQLGVKDLTTLATNWSERAQSVMAPQTQKLLSKELVESLSEQLSCPVVLTKESHGGTVSLDLRALLAAVAELGALTPSTEIQITEGECEDQFAEITVHVGAKPKYDRIDLDPMSALLAQLRATCVLKEDSFELVFPAAAAKSGGK